MRFLTTLLALAAALLPGAAQAQDAYPSRQIRIIVPFTPGSATDVMARIVGERLNAAWGQPVIVDNRPGAGGIDRHPRDRARGAGRLHARGRVLGPRREPRAVQGPRLRHAEGLLLRRHARQPAERADRAADLGVNSVKELVAMLKAKPGAYNYATAGVGSGAHVSMREVQRRRRRQGAARAAQGHAADAHRDHGRPRRVRVGAGGVEHGPGPGRQGEAARGEHAAGASRRCPTCRPSPRPAFPKANRPSGWRCSRRRRRRPRSSTRSTRR